MLLYEEVPRPFRPYTGALGAMGAVEPGPRDPPELNLPFAAVRAGICNEAAQPGLYRHALAGKPRLLVNASNDGWYRKTWAPQQLFAMNVVSTPPRPSLRAESSMFQAKG